MRLVLLSVALLACGAHAQAVVSPCAKGEKACAREVFKRHPAKQPEFWKAAFAKPVEQRIGPAPPELIEILAIDNVVQGYPNKPHSPRLTPEFLADVRRAFAGLPESVKRAVAPKLAGIYFVDDLGGTGFTDEINDPSGTPKLGFIVLDPSVLMPHTANGWASWKESTPFKAATGWKISVRIEDAPDDTRANAIQYILLHELGHVISIGANIHPSWTLSPKDVGSTRRYPYFQQSWRVEGDRYATIFDGAFKERDHVVFYFGAKLEVESAPSIYDAVQRTSFATLYAATHPADDFAEAFASYVHVVLMKKPFDLRVERDGVPVKTYAACWSEPRCQLKKAFLDRLLAPQ